MKTLKMLIHDGGIPAKVIISQLLLIIDYYNWYQMKAQTQGFFLLSNMQSIFSSLICVFMNFNKLLKYM